MGEPSEDSRRGRRASIEGVVAKRVLEACRSAAAATGRRRLEILLEGLLDRTGAERAFVAVSPRSEGRADPRVVAGVTRREDGSLDASRTVLLRALASSRGFETEDAAADPRLVAGLSVRDLSIRRVASVPLPTREGAGALVLDGRSPAPASLLRDLRRELEAFGAVIGLTVSAEPFDLSSEEGGEGIRPPRLVGRSLRFSAARARAATAAATGVPILLLGETGSGKEEFARSIHAASGRARGPFVAVNCAALPDSLLEAELFGSERGAFTGADRERRGLVLASSGGTLFLDEIGEMSASMQAKLLRALQERRIRPVGAVREIPVDLRVVAATHRELPVRVREGTFREDLYWRLAVGVIAIPPLRERLEDLPSLSSHLVERLAVRWGLPRARIGRDALGRLLAHDWPGNVRELEGTLARALLASGGRDVTAADLSFDPARRTSGPPADLESKMIEGALAESRGVLTAAAGRIGWSRQKLRRRMARLGISARGNQSSADGSESESGEA